MTDDVEYRLVHGFPDYAISNEMNVRNLNTGDRVNWARITSRGGHMVVLYIDGKPYGRAVEQLFEEAFPELPIPMKENPDEIAAHRARRHRHRSAPVPPAG